MPLTAKLLFRADGAAQVKREADAVAASVRKGGDEVKKSSALWGGLSKAANYALGGMVLGAGLAAKAGLSLQASQTQVRNALDATGAAGRGAFGGIEKQLEDLSTRGGGSVEQMNAGIAQFVNQTHSATQAQRANEAAVRLSIKTGMSYSQAEQLISGALAGRTRGLQKYMPMITPVKAAEDALTASYQRQLVVAQAHAKAMGTAGPAWLKQWELTNRVTSAQRAAAATTDKQATSSSVLNKVLSQTARAHESAAQKIQDAKHAFENLAANVGVMLVPVLEKLAKVAEAVAGWMSKNKTLVLVLAGVIAGLALAVKAVNVVMAVHKAWLDAASMASRLFGTASVTAGDEAAAGAETATIGWQAFASATLIGLLIPAIVLIATHFKQVKEVAAAVWSAITGAVTTAFHAITGAFSAAFNFIGNHWKLILSILTGPIGAAVIFVATHFAQVKHFVSDVIDDIKRGFAKIFDIITWPFRKAISWIKSIAKDLNPMTYIKKGLGLVGGLASDIGLSHGGPVRRARGGPIYRALGGPSGSDTVPSWLTPGEFVLNRAVSQMVGTSALERLNSGAGGLGGGESVSIVPGTTVVKIDSRVLAEAVTSFVLKRAARGSASLVGGGIATGVSTA